jgi:streptomycin 6-kinase
MVQDAEADRILAEALAALEMPRKGVVRWLDHLERFYRQHGAERHYGECLTLLGDLRRVLGEMAKR